MQDYRQHAREALARAKTELATSDDERLKYAALELRMAMEAVTYDRARAYKDEFPPSEYETWQPRKLMAVLLEIDPHADKDSSISVGLEETPGQQAEVMEYLGGEKLLGMKMLKSHYDALGSYLHMPSLKIMESSSKPDHQKLQKRCESIVEALENVLSSPVFNMVFGNFTAIECACCGAAIRKRFPPDQANLDVTCFGCGAGYKLEDAGGGQCRWIPRQEALGCANPDCSGQNQVWSHRIKPGARWNCPDCSGTNLICLGIEYRPKEIATPSSVTVPGE